METVSDDWDRLLGLVAEMEQRIATIERKMYEAERSAGMRDEPGTLS